MLRVEGVSFGYTKEKRVLSEVSLCANKGEFVAICGRNGSGKTTLTRLIMGMERLEEGRIYFQDKDITKMPIAERGHHIGYVFQRPDRQMFRNTVAEEIAFGPEQLGYSAKEVKEITERVMEKVGLLEVQDAYPLQLRRGLKQRIAIASALAMKSQVLILDEPTSGQDARETLALLSILKELQQEGMTILFITHNMDIVAEYADRVVVVHEGRIAFDDAVEVLFTRCEEIFEYGLEKPMSVKLSEKVAGMKYAPTMEVFEREYIALQGGE